MKKFYIDYISKIDGDVTHVWLYARSKEHAKNEVKHEYWDVQPCWALLFNRFTACTGPNVDLYEHSLAQVPPLFGAGVV